MGIAFQVGVPDPLVRGEGREHLSLDFIDRHLGTEGKGLRRARLGKKQLPVLLPALAREKGSGFVPLFYFQPFFPISCNPIRTN